jgi:hypothetical protein
MSNQSKPNVSRKIKSSSADGWSLWRCQVDGNECVVVAYVEGTELWQPIAQFAVSKGLLRDVERLVKLMNERQEDAALMRTAVDVLEAIEEEGFTFATEMELSDVIERLESRGANPI